MHLIDFMDTGESENKRDATSGLEPRKEVSLLGEICVLPFPPYFEE